MITDMWPAPGPGGRTRARMVLLGEDVIFEDGPTDRIMNTHSMRKSFLSLLYGIAVEQGYSASRYDAFGYTWWISQKTGTVWTDGYGEQYMLIDPVRDLTLVERNFTGNSYLSTLRWMLMGEFRFSRSLNGMIAAHAELARWVDENPGE
ncbi:MAG TPA: hypothetical protein ENK28_00095 [Aliiroseovarius sp.]|nr:hypothetical protein [Aliiroseovarius sp.]